MKTPFFAGVLMFIASLASAQTGDRSPVKPPPYGAAFAFGGRFKSTDGSTGTFVQTEESYSEKSGRVTVTYTRSADHATRTETTTRQTGPDGTRTEIFTATDYNAAASFLSNRTITVLGRGQSVGQGTYTTADGVSGTLTTLETQSSGGVDTITFIYNSAATGMSTEQRTQTQAGEKTVIKTSGVDANGKPTGTVQTRTLNVAGPGGTLSFP